MKGRPFVFVADGKGVYKGAFWTPLSSLSVPEVPYIFIPSLVSEERIYQIRYDGDVPDPRDYERLYTTLKKLGVASK